MLVVAWKSGFVSLSSAVKQYKTVLIQEYCYILNIQHYMTIMLLQSQVCFTTLVEFNLQKLLNFLLHPLLSPVKAELSSFSLKAVKENEKVQTEI